MSHNTVRKLQLGGEFNNPGWLNTDIGEPRGKRAYLDATSIFRCRTIPFRSSPASRWPAHLTNDKVLA